MYLKARVTGETLDHKHRLQNLKTSLKSAYKTVAKANRKSHRNNRKLYDRKAKTRKFEIGELVYLYNPAMKLGPSRKFYGPLADPFRVTKFPFQVTNYNFQTKCQLNIDYNNLLCIIGILGSHCSDCEGNCRPGCDVVQCGRHALTFTGTQCSIYSDERRGSVYFPEFFANRRA